MSWTMWHEYGVGFDVGKADLENKANFEKFKDFCSRHREALEKFCDVDKLTSAEDLDDFYEMLDYYALAEPIAAAMTEETGIRFCSPGLTDNSEDYVLFTNLVPWDMTPAEKELDTFEKLLDIMRPYAEELGVKLEEDVDLIYAG